MKKLKFPIFLLFFMLAPLPVHAYVDPGAGSMFVQAAIAAALSSLVALKIFWQRLKAFFKGGKDHAGEESAKNDGEYDAKDGEKRHEKNSGDLDDERI